MDKTINFEKMAVNSELNSLQESVNTKTQGVEIFSAMCEGKDLTKYGSKVDAVNKYIKATGERAVAGDVKAQAELNAIRTEMIEAPLLKRLNLFDFMGEKITVGYDEVLKYKVYNLEGNMSNWQAINGTFSFADYNYKTRTMDTENITGGVAMDYREFQTGNCDAIAVLNEQCVTDMFNKVFYRVMTELYKGVKNASIHNFSEASGLTKTSVDAMLKKARRWGNVTLTGDFSVISQLEDFAGFSTNSTTKQFSQAVMDEIMKTGLLKTYKGTPVVEIPNTYNLTKLTADGSYYDTYLPEGLLFGLVSGAMSALKVGFRGGLQSMAGDDINTRKHVIRYDLECGTILIPEYAGQVGLVSDSNFAVEK